MDSTLTTSENIFHLTSKLIENTILYINKKTKMHVHTILHKFTAGSNIFDFFLFIAFVRRKPRFFHFPYFSFNIKILKMYE